MRMNKIFNLVLGIVVTVISTACTVSTDLDTTIEREVESAVKLKEEAKTPMSTITNDVIRVKDDIWLGDTSEIEYEGDPIPSYLETPDGITLISNRPITLYEIGGMINKITSLSVRYEQELEAEVISLADGNKPSLESVGEQWADSTKMLVSYKGPLTGLLDEICNRFGIWWKFEKKQIFFYKYITKTFVLYSLPTNPSLSVNVGGSSTEGSAGSSSVTLTNSANIDLWTNIETSLRSMVSQGAQINMDSSNGTIVVTGTPTDIRKVAKFINEQNIRLSRQVAISVKVLQVNISNEDSYGLNLSAAFAGNDRITNLGVIGANGLGAEYANNLAMTIVSGRWTLSGAIQAFSEQGTTNLITSGTVTTLNNKPAPIQVVKTQNYISEITKTNSGSDGSYYDLSTTTEEIETGFTLDVLPRILEHGRLMLLFNLTLSDLIELQRVDLGTGESSGQYIQNPIIETRGFTQEVAMKSGDTLILSGYERVETSSNKTGVGSAENSLLGGNAQANKTRSILVIMLTPVVLESPLAPESRMKL